MIKNVLTHIGGIGIYGVISICLFFTVFTGMAIWAMLMRKSVANHLSTLPLDDGTSDGFGARSSSSAASPLKLNAQSWSSALRNEGDSRHE